MITSILRAKVDVAQMEDSGNHFVESFDFLKVEKKDIKKSKFFCLRDNFAIGNSEK